MSEGQRDLDELINKTWELIRQNDFEKEQATNVVFDALLSKLGDEEVSGEYSLEISLLISANRETNLFWEKFLGFVRANIANDTIVQAAILGVIEDATTAPVDFHDMQNYMKMLDDKETAMVLFASYHRDGFPANFLEDYAFYCRCCEGHNLERSNLNYADLQWYLENFVEE